ncbi:hypothetical protein [uncultured Gordonia sp.]|uniref:hypothetical protein n=1 Tax=uncultured Gordonia sp. TaxID=198437 RepID=UPI002609E67B|nr:hypothetical protein [uncultured Gordonia sp.]
MEHEQHDIETKELESLIDRTISVSVGQTASVVEAWARRNERLERARQDRGGATGQTPQIINQPESLYRRRSAYDSLANKARQIQDRIRTQLAKDQPAPEADRLMASPWQELLGTERGEQTADPVRMDNIDPEFADPTKNWQVRPQVTDRVPDHGPTPFAPAPERPRPQVDSQDLQAPDDGVVTSALGLADKYADRNVHAAELGDIVDNFMREHDLEKRPGQSYKGSLTRVGQFFRKHAEPSTILDQLAESHASTEADPVGDVLDRQIKNWGLDPDELLTKPREEALALITEGRSALNDSAALEVAAIRERFEGKGSADLSNADRTDADSQRVSSLTRQAKAADNSQAPPRAERIDQAGSSPAADPATVAVAGHPTNPHKATTTNAGRGTRSKARGHSNQMQRERQKGQNRGR